MRRKGNLTENSDYSIKKMSKRALLVAATSSEANSLEVIKGIQVIPGGFLFADTDISLLVTGVGSAATAWALTKWISSNAKPDLAINIGIAGSYRQDLEIGEVVMPVSDCFADAGIDTGKGFLTLAEAGLEDPDSFPFRKGKIVAENSFVSKAKKVVKPVNAITVNTSTGSSGNIEKLAKKFKPDIETMEGATFFYICSRGNIPFLALRSISNRVEPRNKDNWKISLALNSLSEKLREVLLLFD
jgi:futalosine hydrolase